jgi:glutamine amidotransferase
MIAIIDYGVGNIKAFANIYKNLGIPFKVAKSAADLEDVTKLILPGVGSFDHAMQSLQNSGMKERLDELVLEKKLPVLGICVGLQILAKSSDEGKLDGLGWLDAHVKKFDESKLSSMTPLPHMGWNNINIVQYNALLKNLDKDARFYFLHSYFIDSDDNSIVAATATYSETFTSIVHKDNIYGIQPHPEKSHQNGITLLKNFGEL